MKPIFKSYTIQEMLDSRYSTIVRSYNKHEASCTQLEEQKIMCHILDVCKEMNKPPIIAYIDPIGAVTLYHEDAIEEAANRAGV